MKRKLVMGLLAAGAFLGFASGFAHIKHHKNQRKEAFLQQIEDTCYNAARRGAADALSGGETLTAEITSVQAAR